jgi:hypothetical protein
MLHNGVHEQQIGFFFCPRLPKSLQNLIKLAVHGFKRRTFFLPRRKSDRKISIPYTFKKTRQAPVGIIDIVKQIMGNPKGQTRQKHTPNNRIIAAKKRNGSAN